MEICRYLTFDKFAWLLEKCLLYHNRLDQFEDPFEGSVTHPYALQRESGESGRMGIAHSESINTWRLKHSSYATCWYASQVQSDAMWKLYSDERAGVAIVSTPQRLRDSVDIPGVFSGSICPVEYLDFSKDDMRSKFGTHLRIPPGFVKSTSFVHEKEVCGLLVPYPVTSPPEVAQNPGLLYDKEYLIHYISTLPKGINLEVKLPTLIQRIVISPLASDWFAELVRILAGKHGFGDLVQKPAAIEPMY